MNWKDIKNIIKEELKEAEVNAGDTKFNLLMGVNRNKTKLGIKIQFEEKSKEPLSSDARDKLEVALQERLNKGLEPYKMIANVDTDVPYRDRMDGSRIKPIAFFIPLSQLKALVVESLGQGEAQTPKAPEAPAPVDNDTDIPEEEIDEAIQKEVISEMRIRELNEISKVVKKEDFYEFINKGNNILRDLEGAGMNNGKKYLIYLIKHNIM